jgi:OmpA-OmpF porin, OOP family
MRNGEMLKSQAIQLCAAASAIAVAIAMLSACSSTPQQPVSHARPVEPAAHTQQVAAAAPAYIQRFTLRGDANFETDSAELTAAAAHELDRLIDGTRRTSIDSIRIYGYTDTAGSDAHNQELSERRALSVAQYLAAHGMKARRSVQVRGFGKANPIASNATAEGRAQNRRVEIVLDEQKVKSQ